MINNKLIFPAQIEYIGTRKDKTLLIKLGTQELTPDVTSEIIRLHNTLCYILIKPEPIIEEDKTVTDNLNELTLADLPRRTQSQRLRSIFFILFTQNSENFKEFESYYQSKMEVIINHYKLFIKSNE